MQYFYGTWEKFRTGRDDVLPTRITTLAFLLLELSPFVLFLKLILCPLCNSDTLWNILIVFGRNVEQDEAECCLQE